MRRKRATPWKTSLHQSELLPELRRAYHDFAGRSKLAAPWYSLAQAAQLNPQTVQRVLACTKIRNPTSGRQLAALEAIARAMGLRVTLAPLPIKETS
jgi:hypothetical protein